MIRWAGFPAWADWTDSKPIQDFEPKKIFKFASPMTPFTILMPFQLSVLAIFSENHFRNKNEKLNK